MYSSILLNKTHQRIIFFLLIGSWIHQFGSLSSFITFDYSDLSFKQLLQSRNLIILILPLNLILFFFLKKRIDTNLSIFFFLFIAYSIGILNYQSNIPNLDFYELERLKSYQTFADYNLGQIKLHLTFVLNIFLTILIVNNVSVIGKVKYLEIIITISLVILFIIVFLVFFQKGNLLTNPTYNLSIFGSNRVITSNGISRTLMIIFIFVFCKAILTEKKLKYFLFFFCIIGSYLIISNEGRLNFISLVIAISIILFVSKLTIKKIISAFTLVLLIPLFISMIHKGFYDKIEDKELFFKSLISLNFKVKTDPILDDKTDPILDDKMNSIIDAKINSLLDGEISSIPDNKTDSVLNAEVDRIINAKISEILNKKINPSLDIKPDTILNSKISSVLDVKIDEIIEKKIDSYINDKNTNFDIQTIFSDLRKNRLFGFQGELRGISIKNENLEINFNPILNSDCVTVYANTNSFVEKINALTTGRIKKWQCALHIAIKNNSYLGNGPEYDRTALNINNISKDVIVMVDEGLQFKAKVLSQGEDVANGALYAILCGGLIAIICYILIIFRFSNLFLKFLISKKKKYLIKDYLFLGSLVTVGYLIGRSFFENGFPAYGIDFLIFIPCYISIFDKFNNLKNIHQNP
jgi:hypothetical protein